jgi:hypothetical protein
MNIDSNMIQRLVNALNRNSEIAVLTAALKGSECVHRCGRFGTKSCSGDASPVRFCDECAKRVEEDHFKSFEVLIKWSEAPSAARARRLEALLKNEGFIPSL